MTLSRSQFLRRATLGLLAAPLAARRVVSAPAYHVSKRLAPIDHWCYRHEERHSRIHVTYYESARQIPQCLCVEDRDRVVTHGYQPKHVILHGVTSQAQAQRFGRYLLEQQCLS